MPNPPIRNPENAGMAKTLPPLIGQEADFVTTRPAAFTVRVKIIDARVSHGFPLYRVRSLSHPTQTAWVRSVTLLDK